jgi:hypothetical protein
MLSGPLEVVGLLDAHDQAQCPPVRVVRPDLSAMGGGAAILLVLGVGPAAVRRHEPDDRVTHQVPSHFGIGVAVCSSRTVSPAAGSVRSIGTQSSRRNTVPASVTADRSVASRSRMRRAMESMAAT